MEREANRKRETDRQIDREKQREIRKVKHTKVSESSGLI